ncbi:MAG: hypothetical protein BRD33_03050 [Bacteroidetes bacterium QH_6_63_17]|nr:MAG: hypothetical protein BRD33_03050 [Bacteroidetes bacterium QH_6_63_17]
MLRNYLKIALRTLWKQKGITAINVLGLAAGMAVCLLVGLLFWDQVTHDDFHPDADRIYRVTTGMEGNSRSFASSPAPLAPTLRKDVTGVEAATRLTQTQRNVVIDDQGYKARGLFAEPSFFELFGFDLDTGNPEEALSKPYTVVLTRDFARRLFGDANPMGKTIRLAEVGPFTVTGVLDRETYRSHLAFDALYSFPTLEQTRPDQLTDWAGTAYSYYTYLRLEKGRVATSIGKSLQEIRRQRLPPATNKDVRIQDFHLQALADLPLSSAQPNEIATGMLPAIVGYFLGALALLVLVAAGFNYVNLSTARSLTRAREVGVRKTVGAHRWQVFGQFVVEGMVVALLALGLAVLFLQVLVPAYNQLWLVEQIRAQIAIEPGLRLYGAFVLFAVGVGIVAGLYPAWHLSKFHPSRVLKASGQSKTPGFTWLTPRKGLVVLQFAVATVVIVTAVLIYRQAEHMARAQVSFRTDNIVHLDLQEAPYRPFQREARRLPGVKRMAAANNVPFNGTLSFATLRSDRLGKPIERAVYYAVDHEFIETLDLSVVAATGEFSESRFERGQDVLVNETAVEALGFETPRQALGHSLTVEYDTTQQAQIGAVVQDFHLSFSWAKTEYPVVFHYNPSQFDVALAQVTPGRTQAVPEALGRTWSQFDTVNPLKARFYQEVVRKRYAPLAEASRILVVVAGLAVLISCLGLLGIATYTVQTRVREVGIRKALGATVGNLVTLLSKNFLGLVGAAVVLGLPVAWWVNRLWLQGYAYRIDLGVWPFVLSAAGLLALALIAIGSQTVRAARIDPAQTLRDE